jgi:hypothetical protein
MAGLLCGVADRKLQMLASVPHSYLPGTTDLPAVALLCAENASIVAKTAAVEAADRKRLCHEPT